MEPDCEIYGLPDPPQLPLMSKSKQASAIVVLMTLTAPHATAFSASDARLAHFAVGTPVDLDEALLFAGSDNRKFFVDGAYNRDLSKRVALYTSLAQHGWEGVIFEPDKEVYAALHSLLRLLESGKIVLFHGVLGSTAMYRHNKTARVLLVKEPHRHRSRLLGRPLLAKPHIATLVVDDLADIPILEEAVRDNLSISIHEVPVMQLSKTFVFMPPIPANVSWMFLPAGADEEEACCLALYCMVCLHFV